jgi:hypothetical protein
VLIIASLWAGALALPRRGRRIGLTGLVAYLLGAAATSVRPGGDARTLGVNAGLELLGLGAALIGAGLELRRARRPAGVGALLVLGGAAGAAVTLGPMMAAAGWWPPVLVALGLGGAATAIGGVVAALGSHDAQDRSPVQSIDAAVPLRPSGRLGSGPSLAAALGVAAAWLGPHTVLLLAGTGLALIAAAMAAAERGSRLSIWLAAAAALALAAAGWLLATIAGPVGLSLSALPELPLSDAAETLVAIPLATAVYLAFGADAGRTAGAVPWGALAGAAVWLRLAVPAAPEGLAHWQPVLTPLAAAGVWYAAVARRPRGAILWLAVLALAALAPTSRPAALTLIAAAALLGSPWSLGRGLGLLASGLGGYLALGASLGAQVAYTVLAAAGFALGAWRTLADDRFAANLPATPFRDPS